MNILRTFFMSVDGDEFDEYKKNCFKMANGYIGKKKNLLNTQDEYDDLCQDAILAFLEAKKDYDSDKGKFYALYKYKLKTLEQNFISRYLGIGMNYRNYLDIKNENGVLPTKMSLVENALCDYNYDVVGGGEWTIKNQNY